MCKTNDTSSPKDTPARCQFWRKLHISLPTVSIFGLDVTLTLLTVVVLTSLRFCAEYVLVTVFGWPTDNLFTKDAAASVISIFHSLNLVPALITCFACRAYSPSEKMEHAPAWWHECVTALLQFCTGYMLYDAIVNFLWLKWDTGLTVEDYLFLGHHMATTVYMTSTRIIQAGHQSAMMCMLLGESTNPLHNGYLIAENAMKLDCCNGRLAQHVHDVIQISFGSAYVVMRALIAPVICLHMTYDLWARGRHHISWMLILIWTLMIWGVIFGSAPWIEECWGWLTPHLPAVFVGDVDQEL